MGGSGGGANGRRGHKLFQCKQIEGAWLSRGGGQKINVPLPRGADFECARFPN